MRIILLFLMLLAAVACSESTAPQQQAQQALPDTNPANWMGADSTPVPPFLTNAFCDQALKSPSWGAFLSENQAVRAAFCDSLAKAGIADCSNHPRASADQRLIHDPLAPNAMFQNLPNLEALGRRLGGLAYVRGGLLFEDCTSDCDSVFTVGLPDSSSFALHRSTDGPARGSYSLLWFDLRTPQLALYNGIRVGMTRDEVRRCLKGMLLPICEYEGGILLSATEVTATLELHFTDGRLSRIVFNPYLG